MIRRNKSNQKKENLINTVLSYYTLLERKLLIFYVGLPKNLLTNKII